MSTTQKAGAHHDAGPRTSRSTTDSSPLHGDVLAAVTGYALAVETGNGRYRRRLFLTLAAAQNAVNRARERGQYAEVVLVRVVPVGVVA